MSGALALVCGGAATGAGGGGGGGAGPGALTATIGAGAVNSGPSSSAGFPTNTCVATGGTAPYSYAWSESDDTLGTWAPTTAATAAITPHVGGVAAGNVTMASFVCTVTDSHSPPRTVMSNIASYGWQNTRGGIPP